MKKIFCLFALLLSGLLIYSFNLNNSNNDSFQLEEENYTVSDAYSLIKDLEIGAFSEQELIVSGYVLDKPTAKTSEGKLSFTIVDDLDNPNKSLVVFLASSEKDIKQYDKVTIKSYARYYSNESIFLTEAKEEDGSINECNVIAVETNPTNRVIKLASTSTDYTVLEVSTYLSDKKEHYPFSDEFTEKYQQTSGGYLDNAKNAGIVVDRQLHSPNQKWHFFESWLTEKIAEESTITSQSAKSRIYTKLLCPELLLWIYEALGVDPVKVKAAMDVACAGKVAGSGVSTIAKNMRGCVSWEDCIVNLGEVTEATGVSLNNTQLELNLGDNSELTATVTPSDTTQTPSWTITEGTGVISIAPNGNKVTVTALAEGTATIKVSYNQNVFAECNITVVDNIIRIVNLPDVVDLSVNEVFALNPSLNKGEGTFTYVSSNTEVAIVTEEGVITGKSNGSATVIVTSVEQPEISKTLNIEVCNHGDENNPISVGELLEILDRIDLTNEKYTNELVYVKGVVKNSATATGEFTLVDLTDETLEIKIANSICNQDIDEPIQNDEVVIKGFVLSSNDTLQLSKYDDIDVLVLKNVRGDSTISLGTISNAILKVNGEEFIASKLVTNGETFTFTVSPTTGFVVKTVLENNNILTETSGVYSFVVSGNSIISASAVDPNAPESYVYNIVYDLGTRTTAKAFENTTDLFNAFVLDGEGSSLITAVTEETNIYGGGNGGSGETKWYAGNMIKFGTTSVNGSMTLTLSQEVNYIKITGYIHASGCIIKVGDSTDDTKTTTYTCTDMTVVSKAVIETGETSTILVTFDATSNLIIANTNKKALYITSIEFGYDSSLAE